MQKKVGDTKLNGALISVIVPIYKTEPYLRRCVDSILKQTYSNLEIILVDDGSPDRCGVICDEYAEQDHRIIVIHKTNGGLSDARNFALDIMRGDYVTFIDSDDFVAPYYIAQLYHALQENLADISVIAEAYVEEKDDGSFRPMKRPLRDLKGTIAMTAQEALDCMLRQDLFEASAWAKLYRSELFEGVRYPVGCTYEDQGTTYQTFLKSKCIVYTGEHLYFYVQRKESILHTVQSSQRYWDGIRMVENQCRDVTAQWPDLRSAADSRRLSMYFHALKGAEQSGDKKLMEFSWENIVTLRGSMRKDPTARKKVRIAALLSYMGKRKFLLLWKRISS